MTHTEKVHIYFGLALLLMGVCGVLAVRRPGSWARTAWPILAIIIGFLMVLPVEAGTRTYQEVGWGETFMSWIPDDVGYWVGNWFQKAREIHVLQHKLAGLAAIAIGVIALGEARGRVKHPRWPGAIPWLTVVAGLALAIHGGTEHHLPSVQEQGHHWIMGVGFVVAGLVDWLHRRGTLPHSGWRYAWPALIAMTGLDLVLFYRLTATAAGHGAP